jgi:FtsH-binding integral membrane protein
MNRGRIAIILLLLSLSLLVIYGLDVISAASTSPTHQLSRPRGFLPFNEVIRGVALGGSAVIISIVGFVISRNRPSLAVGILLIINGALIESGMLSFLTQTVVAQSALRTVASTMALGGVLLGLGIIKLICNRKSVASRKEFST